MSSKPLQIQPKLMGTKRRLGPPFAKVASLARTCSSRPNSLAVTGSASRNRSRIVLLTFVLHIRPARILISAPVRRGIRRPLPHSPPSIGSPRYTNGMEGDGRHTGARARQVSSLHPSQSKDTIRVQEHRCQQLWCQGPDHLARLSQNRTSRKPSAYLYQTLARFSDNH